MLVFMFFGLLAITPDVVQGQLKYKYSPRIRGWLKLHKVVATWEEAYQKCRMEGNSILASPINIDLEYEMQALFDPGTSYFIGTTSMFYPSQEFVSIEGVALDDMSITDMFKQLDRREGSCLSMNSTSIRVTSCDSRLPYFCYRKVDQVETMNMTECGTTDDQYKFSALTGKCYKLHTDSNTWKNAYLECIAEGGHLIIINNDLEAQVLNNITFPSGWLYLWVGLRDRIGDSDWRSVHGHPIEQIYNTWEKKPEGQCGRINQKKELSAESCTTSRVYICEKNPGKVIPFPFKTK